MGSCTAHALVALLEYNYKRSDPVPEFKGSTDDMFSERFVYYVARKSIDRLSPMDDIGTYLKSAIQAGVKYGAALESSFPYLDQSGVCQYNQEPPPEVWAQALNFQTLKYAKVPDVSLGSTGTEMLAVCKRLLDLERPFIGGFVCYQNLFSGSNGLIPIPSGRISGGHAILFVGYDDGRRVFKFKNSWGAGWGDNGYGYLPYEFMTRGLVFDVWTVYTFEINDSSIGVVRPQDLAPEVE